MTQLPTAPVPPLAAFDLDRLRPRLHRHCTRMVGSALEGEDIVQEALLRALESGVPDRPIENPEAWLLRIAHNLALDFLRRRSRRADLHDEDDPDLMIHPVDEQAIREAATTTLPTFTQLPASQRSVVILFDVLEYSAEKVGWRHSRHHGTGGEIDAPARTQALAPTGRATSWRRPTGAFVERRRATPA